MHDLQALLASQEPKNIAPYIAKLQSGHRYHYGTTAEVVGGYVQRTSGLWVPSGAKTDSGPLDLLRTYITLRQISGGQHIGIEYVKHVLRGVPLREGLQVVASCMRVINAPGDGSQSQLDRDSLDFFAEPYRSRLEHLIRAGSVIHAPQLLMILAKLILGFSPDEVPDSERTRSYLPMLLLVLADNLEVKHPPDGEPGMPLFSSLSLELSANHNFNASVEPDQAMASFQRRWIEIPEENLSQYSSKSLADTYREATGISLRDQAAAMLVLYANCVHGIDVANFNVTFSGMGWDANRARSALKYVTLSSSDYRTVVRRELAEHGLDWYFTAFSRYPLVEFGDDVVLLDPSLLLKRCAGYLPFYDVAEALSKAKRKAELEEFRRAFNDYSERLVVEAFTSMVGGSNGRVFGESDLKRAFPGAKNADFVVDYGDAWVVVEVTTSQVSRDTVNGASLRGLERDRDMVVDEAKQVAATIESLRRNPAKLLGPQEVRRRYYPVVVITEGFPNNPIMQTLIRDHLKGEGYLQGPDIAPLELLSLTDIDMVEGAMENSGVSFTEILRLKSASNFWADSVRNFVLSDTRFDVRRPARIARALDRFFTEVGHEFGQTFDFGDVDDG